MQTYFKISLFAVMTIVAIGAMVLSLLIGRYALTVGELADVVLSPFSSTIQPADQLRTVVIDIRLPRILASFLVGGTLSITGAAYQGMFRNPMVSPSILGVSAGAGFGAAMALLLGLGSIAVQGSAFVFGIVAVGMVYGISHATNNKYDKSLTLILSGMIVGAVFSALISALKYAADPNNTLPAIVYWLMGGLSDIEWDELGFLCFVAIPGLAVLSLSGWKLDLLSFGDDEARTMGVQVDRLRVTVIIIATLMTAAAVSISGIIGWIGLIIPHISRMLIGPRNAVLLPATFLVGGVFLLIVDGVSRTAASMEIPLGIATSLIGAPFFLFILMKTSKYH